MVGWQEGDIPGGERSIKTKSTGYEARDRNLRLFQFRPGVAAGFRRPIRSRCRRTRIEIEVTDQAARPERSEQTRQGLTGLFHMDRHQGTAPSCQQARNYTREDELSEFHKWIVVKLTGKKG
jgi:hypothetical protein